MEETEATRTTLLNFFLSGHRRELVVLQREGKFVRYLTYEGLLYRMSGGKQTVAVDENLFQEARRFFEDKGNRSKLLPVVNKRGELLSFLRWNNQKEEVSKPDQNLEQIDQADKVLLRECSESVYVWLLKYLREHSEKEVILEGEGWEVLSACGMVSEHGNKVVVYTEGVYDAFEISFGKAPCVPKNTVKSMWQLKEDYKGYRIYVWLENKMGVDLFTQLAFSGVRIEGFCNAQQGSVETFLGKHIVEEETLIYEPDVLIVYKEGDKKNELRERFPDMTAVCVSYEYLFEMCWEIKNKESVIFYDSITAARRTTELLKKFDISIAGYSAANSSLCEKGMEGCEYISIEECVKNTERYNLVAAMVNPYFEESLIGLPDENIDIYVPSMDIFYNSSGIMLLGNMGWYLDKAIKMNKKMVLYGMESCFTNAWLEFFHMMGISMEDIVDEYEEEKTGIKSIYNLAYEETSDYFVIVNKKIGEWIAACEQLEALGFSVFYEDYTGLYATSSYLPVPINDVTLGHVYVALVKGMKYAGFHIYGEEKEGNCRIVTLGGSTTATGSYRVRCWPELLYDKFREIGKSVTIYNGGVDGYTAGEELYKLIRDVGLLKPDLVISFSGVNNALNKRKDYPYVPEHLGNIFDVVCGEKYIKGLKNHEMSIGQIWIQQEQMMSAICKEVYGAEFICFAQPVYVSKRELLLEERLKFVDDAEARTDALIFRKEVLQKAEQFKWMVDIQAFLDEKPEVFMDSVHVYESGNKIIADTIYQRIKGLIGKEKAHGFS